MRRVSDAQRVVGAGHDVPDLCRPRPIPLVGGAGVVPAGALCS